MSTSRLCGPTGELSLRGDLLRHLTAATVQDRLALVEQGVAALADRQPYTVNLHEGTLTMDFVQARALSWYFLTDPSLQVRRRFAQRLGKLKWAERFPYVARLVWDTDDRVRRLAERNLGEVELVLVSMEQQLVAKPFVYRNLVLENPAVDVGTGAALDGGFVLKDFVASTEPRGETYRFYNYDAMPATPAEGPPAAYEPPSSPGGPPPPPTGTGNVVRENPPLGEEVIQRYTDCDFAPAPQLPASAGSTSRCASSRRIQSPTPSTCGCPPAKRSQQCSSTPFPSNSG